jgi:hypothetical protein
MPATLASNDGEARFVIELSARTEYADDAGFESTITLRGRHWDGDHTFPFCTSIEGLWLRADVVALLNHVTRWIGRPLARLIVEDLSAEFQLARLPGQRVQVRMGPRDDTISDGHPLFTVSFSAGALQGEFHFVTDQSCLAIFVAELSTEFRQFK